MCLGNFSKADSQMIDMDLEDNQEINVKLSEESLTIVHKINRDVLVGYIKGLPADTGKESFITPDLAIHVIDFVHLLVNREGVAMEHANNLTHEWYKAPIGNESVKPFKDRTKSINEIINHLEEDCHLKEILIDY